MPSRRTIERIWKIYKDAQSPTCLAAKFSRRGVHRSLALDPHVEEIILNVIEEKYCNKYSFSVQDIVNDINNKCKSGPVYLESGDIDVCDFDKLKQVGFKNLVLEKPSVKSLHRDVKVHYPLI